jgi:hypothetical protein
MRQPLGSQALTKIAVLLAEEAVHEVAHPASRCEMPGIAGIEIDGSGKLAAIVGLKPLVYRQNMLPIAVLGGSN